jgi:hypothetical protein
VLEWLARVGPELVEIMARVGPGLAERLALLGSRQAEGLVLALESLIVVFLLDLIVFQVYTALFHSQT